MDRPPPHFAAEVLPVMAQLAREAHTARGELGIAHWPYGFEDFDGRIVLRDRRWSPGLALCLR